jgi:capsular polysaccharide biosynthesis protein
MKIFSPGKKMISTILRVSGIGRLAGQPVRQLTTTQYCHEYYATYSSPKVTIYPSEYINEKPPKGLTENYSWKFLNYFNRYTSEAFVLVLQNARVYGEDGAVITPEGIVLRDVSREFGNRHLHSVLNRIYLNKPLNVCKNIAVLSTAGSKTYYHWMFDILPRIHLIEKSGLIDNIDYYILPKLELQFQKETIKYWGIPENKIITLDNVNNNISAESLIIPSLPSYLGTVNKWSILYLREKINSIPAPSEGKYKKIYISRSNSETRRLLNEPEIIDDLKQKGFQVINAENYSFEEQVAIFRNAEVVIAPHGSGLTNIIWCKPGTKILELFSNKFIVPCFWIISNSLKLDYYYAVDKKIESHNLTPYWQDDSSNYEFSVNTLNNLLKVAGIN